MSLVEHHEELHKIFWQGFEDGLIAIAYLSLSALEQPNDALAIAERWLLGIDDVETADFLGHLVIGPSLLRTSEAC